MIVTSRTSKLPRHNITLCKLYVYTASNTVIQQIYTRNHVHNYSLKFKDKGNLIGGNHVHMISLVYIVTQKLLEAV